ncbi:hypothetical protein D3C85_1509440 [compost metagenome]
MIMSGALLHCLAAPVEAAGDAAAVADAVGDLVAVFGDAVPPVVSVGLLPHADASSVSVSKEAVSSILGFLDWANRFISWPPD